MSENSNKRILEEFRKKANKGVGKDGFLVGLNHFNVESIVAWLSTKLNEVRSEGRLIEATLREATIKEEEEIIQEERSRIKGIIEKMKKEPCEIGGFCDCWNTPYNSAISDILKQI